MFGGSLSTLVAGVLAVAAFIGLATASAQAETRTLKLYFIHTKERAEITFKRNGRYDQKGLNEINRFLRDWRRNEPTKMDPRLLDLVWEAYQRAGGRDYIHVVSAYRSPATNSMLRKRSKGVANKSQHMLGKAMDFYVPGVKLSRLRAEALKLEGGGVGYYPTSGSPFVHMDVGNVRHWPRMNRGELMALFPGGKTIHVPTDGKPLPGYNQALASYQSRKRSGGGAVTIAQAERRGGFLSALFGGGADEAEEESGAVAVASVGPDPAQPVATRRQNQRRAAEEVSEEPQARTRETRPVAPLPGVEEAQPPAAAPVVEEKPVADTPETIIAALPARSVPLPLAAPRPQAEVGPAVAAAGPAAGALALAPEPAAGTPAPPANIPFGTAETPASVEVAANVPLPSRRPDYTPPAVAEIPAQVALAATEPQLPETAPINALAARPIPGEGERAIASVIAEDSAAREAAIPAVATAEKPVVMAALPTSRPAELPLRTEPAAPPVVEAPRTTAERAGNTPASTRTAMLSGADAAALAVKTTAKGKRPSAQDAKPDRKPVVQPLEGGDARWAFHNDFVINSKRDSVAPAYARNLVRAAPQAVYTAGFQSAPPAEDPTRFSGKAVTFLSVAKFATN